MPTPIEYVGGQVEADYHVTMSWDFKAKFSDMPPEGIDIQQEQLGAVPLRGDWCFSLNGEADDLVIEIKHGGLPHAALGNRVMVRGAISYFANGAPRLFYAVALPVRGAQPRLDTEGSPFCAYTFPLSKSRLADERRLPRALQNSLQQYRVSITITQEPEGNVTRLCHTSTPDLTRALQLASMPIVLNIQLLQMLTIRRSRSFTLAAHGRTLAFQAS